ncbi:hypothetical protein KPH14_012915, partial [Odynerus spinipes]
TKLSELRCAVSSISCNYDIIILVETWLHSGISNEELGLTNFNVFRRDRFGDNNTQKRGGGVLIAVGKHIYSKRLSISSQCVEQLFVKINTSFKPVIIGTVYIPPGTDSIVYDLHGATVPDKIQIYGLYYMKVDLYIEPVRVCFNCFKVGHIAKFGKRSKVCRSCGEDCHDNEHKCTKANAPSCCIYEAINLVKSTNTNTIVTHKENEYINLKNIALNFPALKETSAQKQFDLRKIGGIPKEVDNANHWLNHNNNVKDSKNKSRKLTSPRQRVSPKAGNTTSQLNLYRETEINKENYGLALQNINSETKSNLEVITVEASDISFPERVLAVKSVEGTSGKNPKNLLKEMNFNFTNIKLKTYTRHKNNNKHEESQHTLMEL